MLEVCPKSQADELGHGLGSSWAWVSSKPRVPFTVVKVWIPVQTNGRIAAGRKRLRRTRGLKQMARREKRGETRETRRAHGVRWRASIDFRSGAADAWS